MFSLKALIPHTQAKRMFERRYSAKNPYFPYDPAMYLRVEDLLDPSLGRLAADVELLYKYYNEDRGYTLPLGVLDKVKTLLVSDDYSLSPLQVHYVNHRHTLRDLLIDYLMDYTDVEVTDSNEFVVVTPTNVEDSIVLKAISLTLLRLSLGCIPPLSPTSYILYDICLPFYSRFQQIGKVNRIYKIDLDASKSTIPLNVVEEKILDLVGDSPVNRLIGSFFQLPIIDREGKKGQMSSCGIPPVGEITEVLLHLTLTHTLDPEFAIKFPRILFRRFLSEAYIFLKDEALIDEKAVLKLFDELSLQGKIESIGPGEALPCRYRPGKRIYLDSESKVEFCDY